jgi:transcriptional regulator with XRE-family HTH domain
MATLQTDIKIAMIEMGKYQYEIAREVGISEALLSAYLRGRRTVKPETEQQIRTILGLPVQGEADAEEVAEAAHVS